MSNPQRFVPPEWVVRVMNTPRFLGFFPTGEFWFGSGQALQYLGRGPKRWRGWLQLFVVTWVINFIIVQFVGIEGILGVYAFVLPLPPLVYCGFVEHMARRGLAKKYPQVVLKADARQLTGDHEPPRETQRK